MKFNPHFPVLSTAVGLGLLGACLALPSAAQKPATLMTLTLDPAQTHIQYTLSDVLHTVHGAFELQSGRVRFDPASGAAHGDIVINAASGDSGSHARDSRMKKNILQTALYPQVDFVPEKIVGEVPASGPGHFQVIGLCKIDGSEHPLTLAFNGQVNNGRFTGTTHFAIPYVEWGLKNPSTLFLRVSKDVIMDVTAVGQLAPAQGR